jgi:hypothetical protein
MFGVGGIPVPPDNRPVYHIRHALPPGALEHIRGESPDFRIIHGPENRLHGHPTVHALRGVNQMRANQMVRDKGDFVVELGGNPGRCERGGHCCVLGCLPNDGPRMAGFPQATCIEPGKAFPANIQLGTVTWCGCDIRQCTCFVRRMQNARPHPDERNIVILAVDSIYYLEKRDVLDMLYKRYGAKVVTAVYMVKHMFAADDGELVCGGKLPYAEGKWSAAPFQAKERMITMDVNGNCSLYKHRAADWLLQDGSYGESVIPFHKHRNMAWELKWKSGGQGMFVAERTTSSVSTPPVRHSRFTSHLFPNDGTYGNINIANGRMECIDVASPELALDSAAVARLASQVGPSVKIPIDAISKVELHCTGPITSHTFIEAESRAARAAEGHVPPECLAIVAELAAILGVKRAAERKRPLYLSLASRFEGQSFLHCAGDFRALNAFWNSPDDDSLYGAAKVLTRTRYAPSVWTVLVALGALIMAYQLLAGGYGKPIALVKLMELTYLAAKKYLPGLIGGI